MYHCRMTGEKKIAAAATVLLAVLSACGDTGEPQALPPAQASAPTYVGTATCAGCHGQEYAHWRNSHHDLAMQPATADTVLGDFDNATFSYAGVDSRFIRRDDRFFVVTDDADGRLAEFEVAYTFGVEPLQQYLIEFADGRLQALSITWDSRPAADGGQRWFHLYADDDVDYRDPLHWTGPMQNWNFMCAECHSTNVEKNYSAQDDRFATSWSEIDVACEACHGPGSAHTEWASLDPDQRPQQQPRIQTFAIEDHAWIMNPETGIAEREPARAEFLEIETCGRCHSRRSQLTEDYVHGKLLADTHRVSLLDAELYFADGQIRDEVYVYGSFLQSKMFAAGVTCIDCHDAHSLALKADGNAVCAQCHLATAFDTASHHRHEPDSTGAQCVGCHMPSRNFMTIDGRRDHSFRVPRPELSLVTGAPNACNQCHSDRDAEWSSTMIQAWHGETDDAGHYALAINAGRSGSLDATARLSSTADDADLPAIVRATAVSLLAESSPPFPTDVLTRAGRATNPMLRAAAADAARALDAEARVRVAAPLLGDPILSVRLAAAAALLQVPRSFLRQQEADELALALEEYRSVQLLHADRPEAQLNLGQLLAAEGNLSGAAAAYGTALEHMPSFTPAYVNLADLYRTAGREADAETVLRRGLSVQPNDPALHHALGFSLVRQGNSNDAITHLRQAHALAPDSTLYAYVLAIALNSENEPQAALTLLRDAHAKRPNDVDVLLALATISRDQGLDDDASRYAAILLDLAPDNPTVRRLADSLGVR